MVQILDIIHRNKRLSTARNYLFLTLGSTFVFACIYYIAQFINPEKTSIKSKTHSGRSDIKENNNSEQNRSSNVIETDTHLSYSDDNLSFFACLLFSLVTQTTVGFAWFVPTDNITRIIVFLQLLSVLCITTYTLI